MATHHVNRIAPVNLHAPRTEYDMGAEGENGRVGTAGAGAGYFTFTVGKLDAGMAILIGEKASQIEFPSLLLPSECTTGSVVRISVSRNPQEEQRKKQEFDDLQRNVLETFGRSAPVTPRLTLRAVTQTSITLEWDKLELATAKLLSLDTFRNNERLAAIPNALHNTSTKLSGLEVDKPYSFHLVLRTTAGTLTSNVIKTKTHNMTDTTGISVCFGFMDGSSIDQEGEYVDGDLEAHAKQLLQGLGARWSDKIQIDTTHYVCTHPRGRVNNSFGENNPAGQMRGAMFNKAAQLSIPIVLPHWIFACAEHKKLVPISHYYMDKEPPNADKVRQSIGRKSVVGADASAGQSSRQEGEDSAQAAALSNRLATEGVAPDEQLPPTPASKDHVPLNDDGHATAHTEGEGREAAAHPETADQEGPMTTTVAVGGTDAPSQPPPSADDDTPAVPVPATDEGSHLPHSDSAGGLSTGYDRMDEISLGGSTKDDADEEIDLS